MSDYFQLDDLRTRLMGAKERLALERLNILQLYPLKCMSDRAAYSFTYLQAERLCIATIKERMAEIDWLPARLDTKTEINSETRGQMTRWIKHGDKIAPGEEVFGNGFVHAIARCMMIEDSTGVASRRMADRVARLFRDLTCLVAAIHCSHICQQFGVRRVELSAPHDLAMVAQDLTILSDVLLEAEDDDSEDSSAAIADNQNKPAFPPYLTLVPSPQPECPA